jgi:hypothetical protein
MPRRARPDRPLTRRLSRHAAFARCCRRRHPICTRRGTGLVPLPIATLAKRSFRVQHRQLVPVARTPRPTGRLVRASSTRGAQAARMEEPFARSSAPRPSRRRRDGWRQAGGDQRRTVSKASGPFSRHHVPDPAARIRLPAPTRQHQSPPLRAPFVPSRLVAIRPTPARTRRRPWRG